MARIERPQDTNEPTVSLKAFSGLNNRLAPERLATADLAQAVNVDLDNSGGIRRREGFTMLLGSGGHSLWSDGSTCLFVQGSSLVKLNPDLVTYQVLASGFVDDAPVSYHSVNGVVYYSNGQLRGAVEGGVARSWGIEPPDTLPAAVAVSGGLHAGMYAFAATFVRGDGQESGSSRAAAVEVGEGQGVQFTHLPVSSDPDVKRVRIYLSAANGTELFLALEVANGTGSAAFVDSDARLTVPLRTRFLAPLPAGQVVSRLNGRMLVASGNVLWFSEPFAYELTDPAKNYILFDSEITLLAPLVDGVFVATQTETMFIRGADIASGERIPKAPYGAIPGTLAWVDAQSLGDLGMQFTETVAVWASPKGICLGGDAGFIRGIFKNVTEAKISYADAPRGTALLREQNGITQYLALLKQAGDEPSNAFVGDQVAVTVIRNGITIA